MKAVLEGSVAAKGKNCVIYATSNRRHLVRENGADRMVDDLHANDTLQEVKSLSDRFGLVVTFQKPDKDEFLEIVTKLAQRYRIAVSDVFYLGAEAFALRNGGRTPRVAKHYVEAVASGVLKN